METMPSLEFVVIFFKNVILISSMMIGQDPNSIDVEPYVVIKFNLWLTLSGCWQFRGATDDKSEHSFREQPEHLEAEFAPQIERTF